jgi:iron(III) transport system substrate-binding protein
MPRVRHVLGALVASALFATLTACGDAGASDGVDESKLVVYSGRQKNLVNPLIEQFEKDTGVKVSVRYGNTAQMAAQLLEEGDRTKADVFFSQDGGALGALAKKDVLEPLPAPALDRVPAAYRAKDGKWVGTSGRARVLVYDPKQVPEADVPDSVFELTDPKWKGKVAISPSNASFESFVTAIRVLRGEDAARKWLKDMKANDVQTFDNNVAILNAAEDGKIKIGLINHYYYYEQVAEEGADKVPAKLKFLPGGDPGALVNVAGVGVLRGSDRSAEARKFVEYLLSEKGQKYFADKTKEYPLVAGVPTAEGLPPLNTLKQPAVDLADLDTLEQTLTMISDAGLT